MAKKARKSKAAGAGRTPIVSVVIPLFNEGPFVAEVFARIDEILAGAGRAYELIFVDDGSEDETWPELERLARKRAQVRALSLSRNFGKEAALSAGIDVARGRCVIIMDGDLEHPPALIPEMIARWEAGGLDIVEAVKTRRADGPLRRLRAGMFYALLKTLAGIDLRGTTDFKLLDRRVVDAWSAMPERNLFFRGMIHWLGFRREQLSFEVPARVGGETRWSVWKLISLALLGVTAYTTYPLRLITFAGVGFFAFAVFLVFQTLYQKYVAGGEGGFATVIILLLVTGSAIMIGLGIIGEYLGRIYEELKGRPRYVVAKRER